MRFLADYHLRRRSDYEKQAVFSGADCDGGEAERNGAAGLDIACNAQLAGHFPHR